MTLGLMVEWKALGRSMIAGLLSRRYKIPRKASDSWRKYQDGNLSWLETGKPQASGGEWKGRKGAFHNHPEDIYNINQHYLIGCQLVKSFSCSCTHLLKPLIQNVKSWFERWARVFWIRVELLLRNASAQHAKSVIVGESRILNLFLINCYLVR